VDISCGRFRAWRGEKLCCQFVAECDSIGQPRTTVRSHFREKEPESSAVVANACNFRRAGAVNTARGTSRANGRQQRPPANESSHVTRSPHAQAPRRGPSQAAPHHIQGISPVKQVHRESQEKGKWGAAKAPHLRISCVASEATQEFHAFSSRQRTARAVCSALVQL
jgi:hypothetical protein